MSDGFSAAFILYLFISGGPACAQDYMEYTNILDCNVAVRLLDKKGKLLPPTGVLVQTNTFYHSKRYLDYDI